MSFKFSATSYSGQIREQKLGLPGLPIAGEKGFPFNFFEGQSGHAPILALEVWDSFPDAWPEFQQLAYSAATLRDPLLWAQAAVQDGAQAIALQLKSIDPNGDNVGADQTIALIERLRSSIKIPLIIWGCDNQEKDGQVLSAVAASHSGGRLILGPVEEANYQLLASAAIQHGHSLIATSPIDVNLAKQLNILLQNHGVDLAQVLIDPTTGSLGYGLEYTYSVMERMRIAGLQQNDDALALPIICNLGREIWKSKEARLSQSEAPDMGSQPQRGVMMEITAGVALLLAGANVLILSHPQSLFLLRGFIKQVYRKKRY